jgi:hypothetical protein
MPLGAVYSHARGAPEYSTNCPWPRQLNCTSHFPFRAYYETLLRRGVSPRGPVLCRFWAVVQARRLARRLSRPSSFRCSTFLIPRTMLRYFEVVEVEVEGG